MPNIGLLDISVPTIGGDEDEWGDILNNISFPQILENVVSLHNPTFYINATVSGLSAPNSVGSLVISGGDAKTDNWAIHHSSSGTFDFTHSAEGIQLSIASGGDIYRYKNHEGSYNSYGPLGFLKILDTPDVITDWIAASETTGSSVDVSNDSVPSGAKGVLVAFHFVASSSLYPVSLNVRKPGGGYVKAFAATQSTNGSAGEFFVGIDENGTFDAYFTTDWSSTATTNLAYVIGYIL